MSFSVNFEGYRVLLHNQPIIIGRLNGRTVVPISRNLQVGADYIRITGEKICEIFNLINTTSTFPESKFQYVQTEETIPGVVTKDQSILLGWRLADARDRSIAPFQCKQPSSPEDVGIQLFGPLKKITTVTGARLCEYVTVFLARSDTIPSDILYRHE